VALPVRRYELWSATRCFVLNPQRTRCCPVMGGTPVAGHASDTVWTTKKPKPLRAEGLDPDDPAVCAAIDLVRWELSMLDR
jgi:hypothetical protein